MILVKKMGDENDNWNKNFLVENLYINTLTVGN